MKKTLLWVVGGVVVLGAAGFAYWTLSPFFIQTQLDEALPASENNAEGQMSPEEPISEQMPAAGVETSATYPVVDTPAHPASGDVRIVEAGGKTYVRYENFTTLNGPDIFVYLAKDLDAKEYIDLGRVKATEGNINYEVPAGVAVADYSYVLVWCRAFGVLFNYADIRAL